MKSRPHRNRSDVHRRGNRFVVDTLFYPSSGQDAGKRRRYRQEFEKRVDAEAHAAGIRERLRDGLPPFATLSEAGPTVRELLAWNEDVHVRHAESEASREEMLGRHETIRRFPLADLRAESVTVFDLFAHQRARIAEKVDARGNKKRPVTVKGVGKDFVRLAAVFNAAAKDNPPRLSRNVFATLTDQEEQALRPKWRPTPEDSKGRVIAPEHRALILEKFPEPDFAGALRFLLATGCRLDQAASLDWTLHYRDLPVEGFQLIRQKKADRFVAMSATLREIVGPRGSGPVFDDGSGKLYERLQAAWDYRVRGLLKLPYRLHDTRHTVGTELREAVGPENGASALGVSVAMMGIYGEHKKPERDAAALAVVQARLDVAWQQQAEKEKQA